MTFDLTAFTGFLSPMFFIKALVLIFTGMLIVFMFVLLTEINSMEDIISEKQTSFLKLLAFIQIIAGFAVFIYTAFVL
ncbi:hypothetical protein M1615_00460 [Patescibacteria group bacterium]|nr:hypothetical protein [Patescibacteria group bacterium]MCL5010239.1 hypothetical protein [Patescibacteria group bacterium]